MKKSKVKKKSNLLTISEKKAKKRAEQDLMRFRKMLRGLANRTKLVWNGKPYSTHSSYDFQIHPRLVQFFLNLFTQAQARQADQATIKAAEALNEINKEECTTPEGEGNIEDNAEDQVERLSEAP